MSLAVLTVLLLAMGGWALYSASALVAESRFGDQYYFLKRQGLWVALALPLVVAAAQVKMKWVQAGARSLFVVTLLMLVAVLVMGHEVGGARRWIRWGGLGFQPSELAKMSLVLLVADMLDRRQSRLKLFWTGLVPILAWVGLAAGLVLAEKDLGTPVVMVGVVLAMLYVGGARVKHLAWLGFPLLLGVLLAVWAVPYRRARLLVFLDPWKDAQGTGYQLVQSLLALGSGGLWGRGPGQSTIKMHFLPEPQTDFVFPIFGEEFGLIGAGLVTVLFFLLSFRCCQIARRAERTFDAFVALGVGLWVGGQAAFNMAVVTGLLPTKGIPLPFFSFGGSSLVVTLMALGLVLNVSRDQGPGAAFRRKIS